jgi:hypothetical protein
MTSRLVRPVQFAGFVVLGLASSALAQARPASQHATVTQSVGGTEITIDYNRPVARGRTLFGGIVPWGKEWDPGADSATRIRFSTDVRVNGKPLGAGEYSLWAIPDSLAWTVILSKAAHVYHTPYPAGQDAFRIRVAPRQSVHMETLGLYFPVVDGTTAVLRLHWGSTVVQMTIQGQP